ncbi:mitotic-spindle organizing protein 2A [Trichonephila clavipes]|nr:mitotic-spindle organizing protein 2A [Trichonephila clavipes]
MACERKLIESEATTGFFVLLGTKGKKETLEWCMKANLIASRYECPRCKKNMRLQERKGTVDGYEWRCRNQSKDNRHDVVRSVRKGTWFSESKLAITIILRLTRYWFGKSMNAFVVNDLKVNKKGIKGQFDSYLAEYMWQRSNGHKLMDENFHKFLASIARVYAPTDHDEMQA